MKQQKGFTLIELMIVIAIIGILAAIAIPAYLDYTVRAKVSEGLSLVAGAKVAVSEYYNSNGNFAPGFIANEQYGLASFTGIRGSHVSALMAVPNGVIWVFYKSDLGGDANNKIINLAPSTAVEGSLVWSCTGGSMPDKYRPSECRK